MRLSNKICGNNCRPIFLLQKHLEARTMMKQIFQRTIKNAAGFTKNMFRALTSTLNTEKHPSNFQNNVLTRLTNIAF